MKALIIVALAFIGGCSGRAVSNSSIKVTDDEVEHLNTCKKIGDTGTLGPSFYRCDFGSETCIVMTGYKKGGITCRFKEPG